MDEQTRIRIGKEPLRRNFELARGSIDSERRTVEMSFSSTAPVERWWGFETLDHSPEAVDLQRLRLAGNLLVDHDPRDVVGVVERARIGEDGKGRATVRFGRSSRAQEIFQDVEDGIRKNVSVSYTIEGLREAEPIDGKEAFLVTNWQPTEISLVSIPADTAVGVGRSQEGDNNMDHSSNITVTGIREEARHVSNHRIEEINAIAKSLAPHGEGIPDLARRAIDEGLDVETFRQMATARIGSKPIETSPAHLGLSTKDVTQYSILRGLQAQISGDWRDAGFELECSRTLSERMDKRPKGFLVPLDIPFEMGKRTLTSAGAATGKEMIGTDHLAANFIDALRQIGYIFSLGPQILPGLVGNVEIPSMGDATFYHVTEDVDVTDSTPATGEVTLSPKTLGGSVPMSRRFLKQSTPAAEGLMRNLLVRGATVEMEAKIINGSGAAGQPLGILNQTGIGTSTIATPGQPTWAELVEFETDVLTAKGLKGSLAYLIATAVQGHCKTTLKTAAVSGYLMENGEINGYAGLASTNMPANGILFGNFKEILIGLWGGLDIKPDEATKAAAGGLVVRVFLDYDVGVGHALSFSKNA